MEEKVSVIIPTLNEEENIKETLDNFLKQKEKPFEIVVIDNGSKDKTREIVRHLKNKFKKSKINLRLFYYPYGNQKDARDFGIRKSKGTLIGSIDAEALVKEDWILKIKEYFKDPKIVGIGGICRYRNKGKIINGFYFLSYYLRLLFNRYCLGGGNSAFRKSAFISAHGYEGLEELRKEKNISYVKDDYFLSKKLEQKGKLKLCPDLKATILYRLRDKKGKNYKRRYSKLDFVKRIFLEIIYDAKINKHFRK